MKRQKVTRLTKGLTRVLIILLALFIVVGPISWRNALAASSSVSISDDTPEVGDSFTVTVYYSGDSFGSVDGALTYDASVLQYENRTGGANGGNGEVSFSHYQADEADSMSITFYFTVVGSGSCTISANSFDIYNYDGKSLGGDSASVNISVAGSNSQTDTENNDDDEDDNKPKNSNADLKEFSIACGPLTPAFSPEITSYKVTASANETDVDITAIPADPDADVEFGGSPVLTEDHVTREVTVTATDGTKKVYSIEITRNNPTGAINIDGTLYVPSENQSLADIPAGFLASKMTYSGKDINILKSRDGQVVLVKLVPDGESDESARWFAYDQANNSFTPSEIITVDGNRYVVVRNGMSLVYGGPENASGYNIYNPETGEINQVQVQGIEPVETNDTETTAETTPENTTQEETTSTDTTKKKSRGWLWLLLFLILALAIVLAVLKLMGKLGGNKDSYTKYDNDDEDSLGSKVLLGLAGIKDNIASKFSKSTNDDIYEDVDPEEAGMSARRIERRRRIAEAEARAAAAAAAEEEEIIEEIDSFVDLELDSPPISEGSVVTKAELQAAKIAAAQKAQEEAARAAEEARAAQEAAAAAIAARDAARAAKAKIASSELNSKMDELLEVGEEVHAAVNKKED